MSDSRPARLIDIPWILQDIYDFLEQYPYNRTGLEELIRDIENDVRKPVGEQSGHQKPQITFNSNHGK